MPEPIVEPTPAAPVVVPVAPPAADPIDPPVDPSAEPTVAELKAELERIRPALGKANKEAEAARLKLKAVDDAKLSEIEKAQRDAAEATQRADKLERANLLKTVALDAGLPAKWVTRLHGDSEEDLRADALSILADLNKPRTPAPDPSQGPRVNALSEDDQFYESVYGQRKA